VGHSLAPLRGSVMRMTLAGRGSGFPFLAEGGHGVEGVVRVEGDGLLYDLFGQIGRLTYEVHDHADARVPL